MPEWLTHWKKCCLICVELWVHVQVHAYLCLQTNAGVVFAYAAYLCVRAPHGWRGVIFCLSTE